MSIKKNLTEEGGHLNLSTTNEIITIRINDPKDGIIVNVQFIEEITIVEDIFSLLPSIKLLLHDRGTFFNMYNIKNGDVLYVKITPRPHDTGDVDDNEEPDPYIDSQFSIQSVMCYPDYETDSVMYEISGVYNAVSFLNEINIYPEEEFIELNTPNIKTSSEVLKDILEKTSIKYRSEIKTNDNSLWANCNKTRAEFINKVIEHSWIEEYDSPMFYVNKNGEGVYTSIKYLSKKETSMFFENAKYYLGKSNDIKEEKKSMLFEDIQYLNASGPILNKNGYKNKAFYYTPYNNKELQDDKFNTAELDISNMIKEIIKKDGDISNLVDSEIANSKIRDNYRNISFSNEENYIATVNNKKASYIDNLSRNVNIGMYFKEHHDFYDVAPIHNELTRRNFFQNFVNMLVDVNKLNKIFNRKRMRIDIGDKVNIDFSSTNNFEKIHSGNYIIAGISHSYRPNYNYIMKITCVTDGTFSGGIL